MGKIFKFWLISVVFAVTVMVVGVIYFVTVLDPNDYKSEVERLAAKQGITLSINGNLAWQFFPKPGISISNIDFVTQRQDLGPTIDQLSGQIGQATVTTHWGALLDTQTAANQPLSLLNAVTLFDSQVLVTPTSGLPIQLDDISLNVGRLSLQNQPFPVSMSLTALDGIPVSADFVARLDGNNQTLEISELSLNIDGLEMEGAASTDLASLNTTGNLQANTFNLRHQLERIQKRFPAFKRPKLASQKALTQVSIYSDFNINPRGTSAYRNQLALDGQAFNVDINTDFNSNKLTLSIRGNKLNLAMYIPIPDNLASKDSAAIFAPLALPFVLWKGQSQMEVSVGEIELSDFSVSNFYSNIFGNQNVLRVTALSADMFDGQANVIAKLDMRPAAPSFNIQPTLTNINLASALPALAGISTLTGTLNLKANIQGVGNSRKRILSSLTGPGQFDIATPSYSETNIEETFCSAAALFGSSGRTPDIWSKGTQLNDLEGKFQFTNGKLVVDSYSTSTGNLNIDGNATVHLLDKKYDLRANALLNSSITSSNGCSVNSRLQNRLIPFICKGRFGQNDNKKAKPAFCKPDQRALKDLLKNTALEKLGDQLFNSSDEEQNPLQNLFKELLKKNLN
ncbi:AsmA family protein [Porticoccaceae bacterium]|nr:AsmA family protein [Porticoccaceae bacterium]